MKTKEVGLIQFKSTAEWWQPLWDWGWDPLLCSALPWGCCPAGRFTQPSPASKHISNSFLVKRPHPDRPSTPVWARSTTSGGLPLQARVAGDSIGTESCKEGFCTKPGWEEQCVQGKGCCDLLDRMGASSIFGAPSGGAAANPHSTLKTMSYFLASRAVLHIW